MIAAFPLQWPIGQQRTVTGRRQQSRFKLSLTSSRDDLLRELDLLGAKDVVISRTSSCVVTACLTPTARAAGPWHRGLLRRNKKPFVIACDTYTKATHKLRQWGHRRGLRTIQRHGASSMLEQAFTGFARFRLPEKKRSGGKSSASLSEPRPTRCEAPISTSVRSIIPIVVEAVREWRRSMTLFGRRRESPKCTSFVISTAQRPRTRLSLRQKKRSTQRAQRSRVRCGHRQSGRYWCCDHEAGGPLKNPQLAALWLTNPQQAAESCRAAPRKQERLCEAAKKLASGGRRLFVG